MFFRLDVSPPEMVLQVVVVALSRSALVPLPLAPFSVHGQFLRDDELPYG